MKKILFTLLTVVTTIQVSAQDVFYVYRSDSCINTFFAEDIDSIVYSNYDADSIWYDDVVTQVIYEADTMYRIPLSLIDSVGFRTPATEYQPGTIVLEGEIRKYIRSRDSLTLVFDIMTPEELIPKVGDHLVSTVGDEVMPSAFIGKVSTVSRGETGIVVDCSVCSLGDVFIRYYGVVQGDPDVEAPSRKGGFRDGYWPYSFDINPGPLRHDLFSTYGIEHAFSPVEFLSFKLNDYHVTFTETPNFRVRGYLQYDQHYDVNLGVTITGTYDIAQDFRLAGGISLQKDQPLFQKAWPIPEALVDITAELGVFIEADLELAIQRKMEQRYHLGFHWEWSRSGQNMLKNDFVLRRGTHSEEGGATIKGDLHAGGYGQVGIAFIATDNLDIAELNLRFEGGVGMQSQSTFTPSNILNSKTSTALYNELKDKEIETYWYYGTKVEGKLFKWSASWDIPNFLNIPFGKQGTIEKRNVVPSFANTELKARGNDGFLARTNASGRTYSEHLGFMLTNKNNPNDTTSVYKARGYTGSSSKLEHTFKGLSGDQYKVNPLVSFMGVEMLAEPSSEAELEFPVTITSFKVTDSKHQDDSFLNDGRYYDYAFYASTTVELDTERDDIIEWGYVYEDPNGRLAHISLKGKSSPYTDTSYAYYRDNPKSTCVLYGYVKYEGDSEYYYGEKQTYDLNHEEQPLCPDGNHPHMIDLGLPSGTKWACCNVGASNPEGYGGYYAWGETSEKSDYTWENYKYALDESPWYQDLGSDIAGTSYDVAHVKWGGSWRMPSLEQIQELLSNCISEWTSVNTVYGIEFTGPNGGKVFLPAAGTRWYGDLYDEGSDGDYWSSTQNPGDGYAYDLYFNSGTATWGFSTRDTGLSVRPVSR